MIENNLEPANLLRRSIFLPMLDPAKLKKYLEPTARELAGIKVLRRDIGTKVPERPGSHLKSFETEAPTASTRHTPRD